MSVSNYSPAASVGGHRYHQASHVVPQTFPGHQNSQVESKPAPVEVNSSQRNGVPVIHGSLRVVVDMV